MCNASWYGAASLLNMSLSDDMSDNVLTLKLTLV